MPRVDYERIGVGYREVRCADPRIAARIEAALGDARSVVNVGAGTGSYEPEDREVTAVEPSAAMIDQRPAAAASVVQARAEELPFEDDSFDAAMAILSDHHWRDRTTGLREMARVVRRRVLLLNLDPGLARRFWLTRDYLPGFVDLIPSRYRQGGYWEGELRRLWRKVDVLPIPVPHDCRDGFYHAYWRRPQDYLDRRVRDGISVFHRLAADEVGAAMVRLRRDLDSGAWEERYRELLQQPALDVGLRLVVAELDAEHSG
jgi:SAM-dependent methyltransferase